MAKKPGIRVPTHTSRWVCEHYELGEDHKFTPGWAVYHGTRGFAEVTFVRPQFMRDLLRFYWEVARDDKHDVMLCVTVAEDNGQGGTRPHTYEGVFAHGWSSGRDAAGKPVENVTVRMDDRHAHGVRHYYWTFPVAAVERLMVTIDANDPAPARTVQPPETL